MGLPRLIIVILIIAGAVWLYRTLQRKHAARIRHKGNEQMVRCKECGVHLPQKRAQESDGQWYCSDHLPSPKDDQGKQ